MNMRSADDGQFWSIMGCNAEELTSERTDAVINASHEQIPVASYVKVVVHYRLVVSDNVNTCHLRENLDKRRLDQSRSPLWHCKHDFPSGGCNRFLCINRSLDFGVFLLDPVLVAAIVMQPVKNSHRLVGAVGLNEMTG
jgi:hypothetical protein